MARPQTRMPHAFVMMLLIISIQIEMSRALYLDEPAVEKTAGFSGLKESLLRFSRGLAEAVD